MGKQDMILRVAGTKSAGWGSSDPMGGDSSLDLLHEVAGLDPRKAANLVEKRLNSPFFTGRYAAMGVWDVVMSSGIQVYVDAFSTLKDEVEKAARSMPPDDEWAENPTVEKFLKFYKYGRPSELLKERFVPVSGHAGWPYYIVSVYCDNSLRLEVTMQNMFTKERVTVEDTVNPPSDGKYPVDVEDVTWEIYGSKGQKQQSILLKVTDPNGMEYDQQIEMDAVTGKFKDQRWWGGWGEVI